MVRFIKLDVTTRESEKCKIHTRIREKEWEKVKCDTFFM
jgi:hypothetical protein